MCQLSKKALDNPGTIESIAEEWAWRQLDVYNHRGDLNGGPVLLHKDYDVIDPWIREDAQFKEPWPDHQGEYAVEDPWVYYGREKMDAFVKELLERWVPDTSAELLAARKRTLSEVQAGDIITYIGDSFAHDGDYVVLREAETYVNPADAPQPERLVICELMNNGSPMYFPLDELDADKWEVSE